MSQLETPCHAVGYGKFSSVKGGSGSELKNNPAMSNRIGGLKRSANKDAFAEISTVNVSSSLTDVYESLETVNDHRDNGVRLQCLQPSIHLQFLCLNNYVADPTLILVLIRPLPAICPLYNEDLTDYKRTYTLSIYYL
ncbi:hypothetical protein DKX38_008992 [Salix brachista]|uniref:Uncharacterized protein n=1 Tax=Salix brachista TaxID=2182728 RepID=A0A5N5MBQ7_9ROSI|nr:hypothetical protein DKX38_008992 [Salix brachista]